MTRPRGELTTYRARGGHATDWANPTRFLLMNFIIKTCLHKYQQIILKTKLKLKILRDEHVTHTMTTRNIKSAQ